MMELYSESSNGLKLTIYSKKAQYICGSMRNLVPFVQSKKREKHPWRSANFSKVAGFKPANLLKLTLLQGCFSCFSNCTNGTKSRNAPHMLFRVLGTHLLNILSLLDNVV